MNRVPLPLVQGAGTIRAQGLVILALDRSPFGPSLTTPTIYVSKQDRAPITFGLNYQLDLLLVHLLLRNQVTGAVITGADGGNTIMLNMGVTGETALYERMVSLVNWLGDQTADNFRRLPSVARQRADAMDLDRPDRLRWTDASRLVLAEVEAALATAFNRALRSLPEDDADERAGAES